MTAPGNPGRPLPAWAAIGVTAVAAGLFVSAVVEQARSSAATYDETTHLPAGYSYLAWHDYRLNPEHPPLVKMLAALPPRWAAVWPSRIEIEEQDLQPGAGHASLLAARQAWAAALSGIDAQWLVGHHLLYGVSDGGLRRLGVADPSQVPSTARVAPEEFETDADRVLLLGRMPILALGLFLGGLVFVWARRLYGLAGATLGFWLYALDPNFIAHSALVTTDVAASAFMFAAVYFLWRVCRHAGAGAVAGFLVFWTLAFAAKFSAVLLLPMLALLGLGRVLAGSDWAVGARRIHGRTARAALVTALGAAALLASWLGLWATYGFRYSAARDPATAAAGEALALGGAAPDVLGRRPGHLPIEWMVRRSAAIRDLQVRWPDGPPEAEVQRATPSARPSPTGAAILLAADRQLLPEAYLYGLAFAEMKSHFRASFLRGRYSRQGFRSFFLWSFLLKTPPLTLLAIALALGVAAARPGRALGFLVVPVGVYALASVASTLNIGHRHLLPVYPFLFVLCGSLGAAWTRLGARVRIPVAALALAATALSASVVLAPPWRPVRVHPHYLAYFNELAGGPQNGYRSMVDSNLDWGQDLKGLHRWLVQRKVTEPINLCYFGTADPRYHQIPHVNLPGCYGFEPEVPFVRGPGYLAISATNLQGAYMSPELREQWRTLLARARLVDTVGHSIFIYALAP